MVYDVNIHKYTLKSVYFPRHDDGIGLFMSYMCDTNNKYGNCCDALFQSTSQPAIYDFSILKGTSFDLDIIYKDSSKNPVNLTGFKTRCGAQFNNKTFSINTKITDPCHGCIRLFMSPFETSRIFTMDYKYSTVTDYSYQLDIISPSNQVIRIMEGTICVSPSAGGVCNQ